ncbi:MAG: hypothetical protein J7647_28110 [Cyanobacteria bacterium SBLK]|nr:hypothetical protein [Cyanobacteria bacterium SBLK]
MQCLGNGESQPSQRTSLPDFIDIALNNAAIGEDLIRIHYSERFQEKLRLIDLQYIFKNISRLTPI